DRRERLRGNGCRRHPAPGRTDPTGEARRRARRTGRGGPRALGRRPGPRRRPRRRRRAGARRCRAAVPALARCRAARRSEAGEFMTIRIAGIADLAAIMDLERRSFPTDAWSEETMSAELASAHSHYLVDEDGGRVVGYGGLRALPGA